MECLICHIAVTQFDLAKREEIPSKHPEDVTGVLCSSCVQTLITVPKEKIKAAYQLVLDKGLTDKAKVLEDFLEEEEQIVGETTEPKRSMGRKRALRQARTSHHQIRPERPTRQLDKGRVAVR